MGTRDRAIERGLMWQKAKKLIEALAEPCNDSTPDDHAWRECRRCLAIAELESKHARALIAEVHRRIQHL